MILNQSLTEIAKIVGTIEIGLGVLTEFRACTCRRDIAVSLASSICDYWFTLSSVVKHVGTVEAMGVR